MIAEKRPPALCRFRIPGRPFHPTGDRALGNLKSEHKQLAMNARRSSGWVVGDHPEDEIANFLGGRFSSNRSTGLGNQLPIQAKPGSVPTDDGFRGDQEERLPPTRPKASRNYPEESVEVSKAWTRSAPLQHGQLLTQCQILKEETLSRAKKANQRSDAEFEVSKHDAQL